MTSKDKLIEFLKSAEIDLEYIEEPCGNGKRIEIPSDEGFAFAFIFKESGELTAIDY